MKILLTLIFVFVGFAAGANAQLCGTYTTTLEIKSEDNKAIENAVVQTLALEKDETRNKALSRDENDRSKFSITFNEGHIVRGNYKIIVLADGFETSEKEIKFPHCERQTFEIKLKAIKPQNQAILTGAVYDLQGARIPGIAVRAYTETGLKYEKFTDSDGVYALKVPQGIYKIQFCSYNFETLEFEKYRIVLAFTGKMILDVSLSAEYKRKTCNPFSLTTEDLTTNN